MTRSLALKGRTFGRLRVIGQGGKTSHGHIKWLCECSCGGQTIVAGSSLINGATQSCGCLSLETYQRRGRTGRRKAQFVSKAPVTLAPVKLPEDVE